MNKKSWSSISLKKSSWSLEISMLNFDKYNKTVL